MFKAASIGDEESDDEFSTKCESFAVACCQKITDQGDEPTATVNNATSNGSDYSGKNHRLNGNFFIKGLSHFIKIESQEDRNDDKSSMDSDNTDTSNSGMDMDAISAQKEIAAREPEFDTGFFPITGEHNSASDGNLCSDPVYPWNATMLIALGVKPSKCASMSPPLKDKKMLCSAAREHLLEQTEECRAKFALEIEKLLVEEITFKFLTMKSLLDNILHTKQPLHENTC